MKDMSHVPAYGLWSLVIINSLIFIIFAFSFTKPRTPRDWRSFGAFSAFIVALFAEMYGFPLTLYLLSGWLQTRYPGLNIFSHDAGHLWWTLLGWKGDPHWNPIHLLSSTLSKIKNSAFLIRQKLWLFGKYFFHVTDLRSSPKTKTTVPQWFQRQVLNFVKFVFPEGISVIGLSMN